MCDGPLSGCAQPSFMVAFARVFPSLSYRDYQLLWQGNLGTFLALGMQQAAEGWLIYELTRSPLYLSLASICRSVPIMLFAPLGGVLADRLSRRQVMIWTQLIWLATALAVAALIVTERLQAWHLLAMAALMGALFSVNVPARQAFTASLVPRRHVTDAFAIHATSMGVMRILGPQAAGLLLDAAGAATCYVIQTLGYLWAILSHLRIRMPAAEPLKRSDGIWKNVIGGVRYALADANLRGLLALMFLFTVFLYPYTMFLPAFAKDILNLGAPGLGLMMAAGGAGALLGSLATGAAAGYRRKGLLMIGASLAMGLLVLVFAQSRWVWLSLLALVGAGAAAGVLQVLTMAIMQTLVPDEYRGRMGALDMLI